MNRLPVNPTRMELSRLKKQLELSERGHKLLKDKQDELVRRFVAMVRQTAQLRESVEARLRAARETALISRSAMPPGWYEAALTPDEPAVTADLETVNIMGVHVPSLRFETRVPDRTDFLLGTPALARSRRLMMELLPDLLELARVEKSLVLVATEIEKLRRRVNALEYLTIPRLKETIRFIKMRLDDAERERITRLIKMEDMEDREVI